MRSSSDRRGWELALGLLFEVDVGDSELQDAADNMEDLRTAPAETANTALQLAARVMGSRSRIDRLIKSHLENYNLSRLPAVERSILRLAVSELTRPPGPPSRATVRLAADLAGEYGGADSARFVAGVLKGVIAEGGRRRED
ncbi:MAG TPA: transcription antitermination protein NusB [Armatimonadota bacterium]|nr:transcription antitermination protein NusB [Armatimonadota bacterium]